MDLDFSRYILEIAGWVAFLTLLAIWTLYFLFTDDGIDDDDDDPLFS